MCANEREHCILHNSNLRMELGGLCDCFKTSDIERGNQCSDHVSTGTSDLFTPSLSSSHYYRQDGGVYDEARGQKETAACKNIYNWHKNNELMHTL